MLSTYGWYATAAPFKKTSRGTTHNIPRGSLTVHVLNTAVASNHNYYSPSSRDSGMQRRSDPYSNRTFNENFPGSSQRYSSSLSRSSAGVARPSNPPVHRANYDIKVEDLTRGYQILQHSLIPDSFIYERSLDSRSDVLSSAASSISDTTLDSEVTVSSTATEQLKPEKTHRAGAAPVLKVVNPGDDARSILSSSTPTHPFPPSTTPTITEAMQASARPLPIVPSNQPALTSLVQKSKVNGVASVSESDDDTVVSMTIPQVDMAEAGFPAGRTDGIALDGNKPTVESRGRPGPNDTSPSDDSSNTRTVRFSENLICPSPILQSRRRKGWFTRRGDQLWTNDGHYVPPERGYEYPPDLDDYPEYGSGWMNEEGVRIDMQHRLVPKVPLRPALKKTISKEPTVDARKAVAPTLRDSRRRSIIRAIEG